MLGVEADVFDVLGADGLEGSEAYVEGDGFDLDAVCAELVEDLRGEVEAGGGGGGGAGLVREDSLVAVAVFGGVVAVDVGRQRHVADPVEDGEEVCDWGEAQGALAELSGGDDFGFEERGCVIGGGEVEMLAGLNFAAGADEGGPLVLAELLGEEDFDAAGGVG